MAKQKLTETQKYTALKKYLNPYHKFSFNAAPKTGKYTPAQKAAITRAYNKLSDVIESSKKEKSSFINTQKLKRKDVPPHDGVKTNKGFFFKYPAASLKKTIVTTTNKNKKTKKAVYEIFIDYSKIGNSPFRELYFKFPDDVKTSLESIDNYVEYLKMVWRPLYVKLSADKRLYATKFNIFEFFSGSGKAAISQSEDEEEMDDDNYDDMNEELNFFSGVILGFDVDDGRIKPSK